MNIKDLTVFDIIFIGSIIFIIIGSLLADFKIIVSGVFSFSCGFLIFIVSLLSGNNVKNSLIFSNTYTALIWPVIYIIINRIDKDQKFIIHQDGGISISKLVKIKQLFILPNPNSQINKNNTLVPPSFDKEVSKDNDPGLDDIIYEVIPNKNRNDENNHLKDFNTDENVDSNKNTNLLDEWYWIHPNDINSVINCLLISENRMISVRNFRQYGKEHGVEIEKYVSDCRSFLLYKGWAEVSNNNSAKLTIQGKDELSYIFWNVLDNKNKLSDNIQNLTPPPLN